MSDQEDPGKVEAEAKARAKYSARESRFTFRKLVEHQMRTELKEESMEKCDPQIKVFAECAEEQGLMVVFSCQAVYKKVKECMEIYNGEEAWQEYKAKHQDEIDRRANIR